MIQSSFVPLPLATSLVSRSRWCTDGGILLPFVCTCSYHVQCLVFSACKRGPLSALRFFSALPVCVYSCSSLGSFCLIAQYRVHAQLLAQAISAVRARQLFLMRTDMRNSENQSKTHDIYGYYI